MQTSTMEMAYELKCQILVAKANKPMVAWRWHLNLTQLPRDRSLSHHVKGITSRPVAQHTGGGGGGRGCCGMVADNHIKIFEFYSLYEMAQMDLSLMI